MKTKFLTSLLGGGQIIFCLLLINLNILNSQGKILVTGKSQFRNYSFEVKNHCFEVRNLFATSPPTFDVKNYCSTTCTTTYYDSIKVSNNQNINNNITIIPSSPNDIDDYANGVSGADQQAIYKHDQGIQLITDPFKMVAADLDFDNDIDSADGDMISDLILEDIPFTRNSWEWFNSQDIYDNWGSFTSNPYEWTLSFINSGSIFFTNVSTSLLSSSSTQPRYFYFNTTKVGEIDTSSIKNDWVCGSYSFKPKQDMVEFLIAGIDLKNHKFLANESIEIVVSLKKRDSIYYIEVPFSINYEFLNILNVETNSNFPLRHKSKLSKNEFVAFFGAKNQSEVIIGHVDEELLKLKLEVLKPFDDIYKVLAINPKRQLEAGNGKSENIGLQVSLFGNRNIETKKLISFVRNGIYLNQSFPMEVKIRVLNLIGQEIYSQSRLLESGFNEIDQEYIDLNLPIIYQVLTKSDAYYNKLIK